MTDDGSDSHREHLEGVSRTKKYTHLECIFIVFRYLLLPPRDILYDIREFRGLKGTRDLEKCVLEFSKECLRFLYTHKSDYPLPFCDIFSCRFSYKCRVTLIIEDIVSHLEGAPEEDSEPAKSIECRLILHTTEECSDKERARDEFPCFLIMKSDDIFLFHLHMII